MRHSAAAAKHKADKCEVVVPNQRVAAVTRGDCDWRSVIMVHTSAKRIGLGKWRLIGGQYLLSTSVE